jgi:hypothetical protein
LRREHGCGKRDRRREERWREKRGKGENGKGDEKEEQTYLEVVHALVDRIVLLLVLLGELRHTLGEDREDVAVFEGCNCQFRLRRSCSVSR